MHLLQPQPVGWPGLVAMMGGGALFFVSLIRTRIGTGPGGPSAASSNLSKWGIFIQILGFFAAGIGGVLVRLPTASAKALLEGLIVAALMLLAVFLFTAAARSMGANWSVVARMREGHELVTGGVFARLRHPIYTAMAAFLLAMAIAFGHLANLFVALPLFAVGTGVRVREEERLLRAEFGAAYDDYAARVKRFVPGVI